MLSETKSHDPQILRNLIPLSTLSASRFKKLCSAARVEFGPKGSLLFRHGDTKNEFVYLLSGKVSLQAGDVEMDVIEGGTEASRFAIAHQIPRKVNALAKTKIQFVRIDSSLIYSQEPEAAKSQTSPGYEVSDLPGESSSDWMTELLKSPIFERLPASNLQKVIMSLEEVPVIQGEEIFRQGDTGDYYYIIKSGQCTLTRKPNPHAKEIILAKLKTCDAFGEDALISNQPRNVSITMLTSGCILRLKKDKFLTLIKEPVISYIDSDSIEDALKQGCNLIDLRSPDDYENFHLPESKNIPFFSLRMQMHTFGEGFKPILVCEDGNTSQAAAFLLIREGFTAEVLRRGIESLSKGSMDSSGSQAKNPSESKKLSADNSQLKQAEQTSSTQEETQSSDDKEVRAELEQTLARLKEDSEQRIEQVNDKLKQQKDSNHSLTQEIQELKQKIEDITNKRKKIEEGATAQQSAGIKKITDFELTIRSLEKTQKQKDESHRKDLEKASEKTRNLEQEGQRLKQQHSESSAKLEGETTVLKGRIREIEEQAATQRFSDSGKIAELESTLQSFDRSLKQKEESYHKSLKLESEKINLVKQKGKQLVQQFSRTQAGLEKEIVDLKGQLKNVEEQGAIQRAGDSEKISELESIQKSLEQTLEQKDELYRKNQIAASERIAQIEHEAKQLKQGYSESVSALKKEMARLDVRLKETTEEAGAQQATDLEKIIKLESVNVSLEETLEQKDGLYRKNQIAASERITQLEKELMELTGRHSESATQLEQEIADLKGHGKEIEEQTTTQRSADAEKIAALESTNKSLDRTLEQKDKDYFQDLKESSEKFSQLAQDRTESIQQRAEITSSLEQEITRLKERLESEDPKDSHLEETEKLFQTKETDYKKQISAFKSKNDSLQINLTQKSEDIKALESNLHSLQEDNTTLHSRLEKTQGEGDRDPQEAETIENYQQRISELKEQIAAAQQDKEEKEHQVEALSRKSTELESVVENLTGQSERNGGSEDVASLKKELEMIRTHANSDFEAMIQQLKTAQSQAEQFKKALRQEKKRVAQLESELDQPLTVSTDFTATDDDIFSTEDTGLVSEKTSGKTKTTKKLTFWKS